MRRKVLLGKATQKLNPVVADVLNGEEFRFLTLYLSPESPVQDSAFNVCEEEEKKEEEEEAADNLAYVNSLLGRSLSKEGGSASGALAGLGGKWTEASVMDAVQAVRGVRGFRAFSPRDFTSRIRFLV
jgi:hypothetical protein